MENFFLKGAEAELTKTVFEGRVVLSKKRLAKNYRNPILDKKIRKSRTRGEAKLIKHASLFVNTPRIISVNENESIILMEFINGKKLKEVIEKRIELCEKVGKEIKKIHESGVIHGDLTTSNIIVANKKKSGGASEEEIDLNKRIDSRGELFFIDFGLGYFSKSIEDRATDLVVFKKTFNATHSKLKNGWELVMKGYKPTKELSSRMDLIEKRARYH